MVDSVEHGRHICVGLERIDQRLAGLECELIKGLDLTAEHHFQYRIVVLLRHTGHFLQQTMQVARHIGCTG